jgi:hypothetical protein
MEKKRSWNELKSLHEGAKGLVVSSGAGVHAYLPLIRRLKEEKSYVVLAYKSVYNLLGFEPDILMLDPRLKQTKVPTDATIVVYNDEGNGVAFESLRRSNEFRVDLTIRSKRPFTLALSDYEFDENVRDNTLENRALHNPSVQALLMMRYMGIDDVTMFGFSFLDSGSVDPRVDPTCAAVHGEDEIRPAIDTGNLIYSYASHYWKMLENESEFRLQNCATLGAVCLGIPRVYFDDDLIARPCAKPKSHGNTCCVKGWLDANLEAAFYHSAQALHSTTLIQLHLHYLRYGYFEGQPISSIDHVPAAKEHAVVRAASVNIDTDMLDLYNAFQSPFVMHVAFPHARVPHRRLRFFPLRLPELQALSQELKFDSGDYEKHHGGLGAAKANVPSDIAPYVPFMHYLIDWYDYGAPLPGDFDWREYREIHHDLSVALPPFQKYLETHYRMHGFHEKREHKRTRSSDPEQRI